MEKESIFKIDFNKQTPLSPYLVADSAAPATTPATFVYPNATEITSQLHSTDNDVPTTLRRIKECERSREDGERNVERGRERDQEKVEVKV